MTMDEPLVRTKDVKPASGERKELTATVRLNVGNASMLNCFRIMLNAAGLDFSLPNDGAVKGAQVDWDGLDGFDEAAATLHDGPDQIVRFVGDQAVSTRAAAPSRASIRSPRPSRTLMARCA